MHRRHFLKLAGAAAVSSTLSSPTIAAPATKVRLGYLHTLAVDGQIWLAESQKLWTEHGLEMDYIQFQTGLEAFQAMTGGSIDMLATGAVLSNFPARGQGKVFLINDVEFATAQLWVHPEMGIKTIGDLKGKTIATTIGTTAHVFLDTALRKNGIDPKTVTLINQRMPDAVTGFISKAVPAVALWVPFNVSVEQKSPDAKMLIDASAFYPEAAIVDGWVAANGFHEKNKDVLTRIIQAWATANDYLVQNPDKAIATLQEQHYQNVALPELMGQFKAEKVFTSREWRQKYADGTVTKWLQQVTDFFTGFAKIQDPVPASKYFDTSLYMSAIKA
ncbi:MAG TPA: ABC transporter substrate-binding protein [Bradyrhizobium sp.]|uniref:ABC transporter substrate-binding protein n=1 Tax=Bradyrhizobium sp. TaxID=376 RepID=UPI002CA50652|nr:ABC transporter substrate-binding protein [Bradyrhizobium sp.]HLZ03758.1 ABC transporter substrate-binding protein [Bradyrhizobium sp.]